MLQNFSPTIGSTVKVSANATPTSVAGTLSTLPGDSLRVQNAGTVLAYFRLGIGAQVATAADIPMLPGSSEVFDKGSATNCAALSSAATACDFYFTNGTGT